MEQNKLKGPLIIATLLIVALLAYGLLTMQDQRTTADKVGDAVHELSQGVDKAGRQLEDRTPGQKLGDTLEDAGDKVKENTNP